MIVFSIKKQKGVRLLSVITIDSNIATERTILDFFPLRKFELVNTIRQYIVTKLTARGYLIESKRTPCLERVKIPLMDKVQILLAHKLNTT